MLFKTFITSALIALAAASPLKATVQIGKELTPEIKARQLDTLTDLIKGATSLDDLTAQLEGLAGNSADTTGLGSVADALKGLLAGAGGAASGVGAVGGVTNGLTGIVKE